MNFGQSYDEYAELPVFDNAGGLQGGWKGQVKNYGTPAMSGRPRDGKGLRLHHDQVIDAGFVDTIGGQPVSIAVGNWQSGLYTIQAVHREHACSGSSCYNENSPTNLDPGHFTSFVVRPSASAEAKEIAVVVPTLTWQAYNPWPGSNGADYLGEEVAQGQFQSASTEHLVQRRATKEIVQGVFADIFIPQGNNSTYSQTGGTSSGHLSSSFRPNLHASPLFREGYVATNARRKGNSCPIDRHFFEWLEAPVGTEWDGVSLSSMYDAFADRDIVDDGVLDLTDYELVMFMGKPEYWTEKMLHKVDEYMQGGGSLLGVAGNTLARKCALATLPSGNSILEVRKWPCFGILGKYDPLSWLETQPGNPVRLGAWRHVEVCNNDSQRDAIFGTVPIMVGGFCAGNREHDFGKWVANVPDPLDPRYRFIAGLAQDGEVLQTMPIVGPEADAYYIPDESGNPTIPIPVLSRSGGFPYAAPYTHVTLLAYGDQFFQGGASPCQEAFRALDWEHPFLQYPGPLNLCAQGNEDPLNGGACKDFNNGYTQEGLNSGFGNIVTYDYYYDGQATGGVVLNVASIYSPLGLTNTTLSNMIGRFVKEVLGL